MFVFALMVKITIFKKFSLSANTANGIFFFSLPSYQRHSTKAMCVNSLTAIAPFATNSFINKSCNRRRHKLLWNGKVWAHDNLQ